jgi:hypothetical protein
MKASASVTTSRAIAERPQVGLGEKGGEMTFGDTNRHARR